MNAIEFIKTPFYISQMNTVVPLTSINLRLGQVGIAALKHIAIFIDTLVFITREAINLMAAKLGGKSTDIILLVYGFMFLYVVLLLEKIVEISKKESTKIKAQAKEIEQLEAEIIYLKKVDRMRENADYKLLQEIKIPYNETMKKISAVERKVNRLVKESQMYQ